MSFKPIETQEQLDAIIQDRVARAKESARKEFEGFLSPEEAGKKTAELSARITNLEADYSNLNESYSKLQNEKNDFENKVRAYELDSVKTKMAQEYGLPAKATQFLFGKDEEEIRNCAKSFEEVYRSNLNTAPLASTEPPVEDQRTAAFKQMLEQMRG